MKTKLLFTSYIVVFLLSVTTSIGQNNYWTKAYPKEVLNSSKVKRNAVPKQFELFKLNLEAFKQKLVSAPLRGTVDVSNLVIEFPTANGQFEKYQVVEAPMMEQGLADKFPMIKTYKGVGIDDPTATMRFSVTQFGLHTISLSGNRSALYIDPYTEDRAYYAIYERASLEVNNQNFECLTDENLSLPSLEGRSSMQFVDTDDQKLRTYRLAQSCTGEYAQIFAGAGTTAQQKANVQAQMTITINRVNEIYERDLAINLEFVANNDQVIYLNAGTDPWSGEYNTQTAVTLDNVIGVNNYDIGHNFNTSGGGNAGCIGCVCLSTSQSGTHKGRGFTGSPNPTGDPFDIDYVAHEMGHQFGGFHTQSNSSCISGSGQTEVEPGSGSSIMGYAGICAPNVQSNSDAHFNYVNIRDISTNIQSGNSSTCDQETNLTNQPPVADAGSNYTIPAGTAFVLTGVGTDPDGTATLTYNWTQNDPEPTGNTTSPQPNWTDGPMYRSILPTTSPQRYLPDLGDVLNGNLTPTWEVTPSVSRTLNFAFTVRDNASGFANGIGQVDSDLMQVNVTAAAGPFVVTSQNMTDIVWNENTVETITWDVAGTTGSGIFAANVDILLSTDGGQNFDTVLASNTPNDGTEDITVPSGMSAPYCRIMVKASNNIFYAVNSEVFAIDYIVTTTCNTYSSGPVNLAIPDGAGSDTAGTPLITTLNVPDSETIDEVKLTVDISHTYINDLLIQLQHPDGSTFTTVWNRECGSQADIQVTFEDGAPAITCANPTTGTYSPSNPLNVFSGLDSQGDWTLAIVDFWNADTGTLNSWSLEICSTTTQDLGVEDFGFNNFSIFPNPNNGEFTIKMDSDLISDKVSVDIYDIRGRAIFNKLYDNTSSFNQTINLGNVESGMYLVNIGDGERSITKKILVE